MTHETDVEAQARPGWRWVPEEPTEAMLEAWNSAFRAAEHEHLWEPANEIDPQNCAYKALLTAAPEAPSIAEADVRELPEREVAIEAAIVALIKTADSRRDFSTNPRYSEETYRLRQIAEPVADAILALRAPSVAEEDVERVREALEPFAQAADYFNERYNEEDQPTGEPYSENMTAGFGGIQVKHYRRARAALAALGQSAPKGEGLATSGEEG